MSKGSLIWHSAIFLLIPKFYLCAQDKPDIQKLSSKRLIDKLEFVVGPSLCFNHGNMFINNFKGNYANGNYVQNRRITKVAYSIGAGAYHSVSKWLDVNARVLWEQKGSRAELNIPFSAVNNDREFITSEYTYNYLTIYLAPRILIGGKNKLAISCGGYYSTIKDEKVHESIHDTKNVFAPTEGTLMGRSWYVLGSDGGIVSSSFIPGMQSFEKNSFGASVGISYSTSIGGQHNISTQLIDNYGLQNANNKIYNNNLREKNHNLCLLLGYVFHRKDK